MKFASPRRFCWSVALVLAAADLVPAGGPVTEVEEVVARAVEAGNGAGPLWCYGAPLIVRVGDDVFASVMEVGEGIPPPGNTRWRLLRRGRSGWVEVAHPAGFGEREPCPLAWGGRSGLLLSVNPPLEPPGAEPGRCDPHLLRFGLDALDRPPARVRPDWAGNPRFTAHSYRGIATDPPRGDVLLLNIDAASGDQRWVLSSGEGRPPRSGAIRFPVRACYPQVALRAGAGHVLALGDVVEPNADWRAHKKAKTGSAWDYVFRRIFHAGAADLAAADFAAPLEIDSVEETGGNLLNLDLWADDAGAAHLLYLKTNVTPILRDEFFPGRTITTSLEYAVVERGRVVHRATLLVGGEGRPETPQYARLHATADGALHAIISVAVPPDRAPARLENRVVRLSPGPATPPITRLDLAAPFTTFFTATNRGGSPRSDVLDLFGRDAGSNDLRYARIRLR